jgi:predicted flap endonuclease-1-like 5' DNA nuclease
VIILAISVAIVIAALAGYFVGSRARAGQAPADVRGRGATSDSESRTVAATPMVPALSIVAEDGIGREKARIIRSLEAETWKLREDLGDQAAATAELAEARRERETLFVALADARSETARYRQLVVDIENKAPPPILLGAAEPDDLKLIVGIGPVLERMLHHLGIGTFRQIARWTERDVADFDAKLPEFPGRIVRDQWVTQARALHESKYGERP